MTRKLQPDMYAWADDPVSEPALVMSMKMLVPMSHHVLLQPMRT